MEVSRDYAVGKNSEIKRPGLRVKQSHPSSVKTAGSGEADKMSLPEDEMGGCKNHPFQVDRAHSAC